jgi:ribosomal protein L15E
MTRLPDQHRLEELLIEEVQKEGFKVPRSKYSSKGQRRRAFRGMTSSGKKMRALKKP